MSTETITIWHCDRCDTELRMPEREQPPQWYRITKSTPPLASPTEVQPNKRFDWQLCRQCSEDFHDWISTQPVRAAA